MLSDCKNNQVEQSGNQMMHGKELAKLKQKLSLSDLPGEEIQLLTVSRPSAYTEYEPFCFMDTPDHFAQEVKNSFLIYIPQRYCVKSSVLKRFQCYNAFMREIISKYFLRNL